MLFLILSFGALSGLYVLLDAPFVAAIQIIVYAGAIMVLFLFVIMLLNAPHEETEYDERVHPLIRSGPTRFGTVLAIGLGVELVWALTKGGETGAFPTAQSARLRRSDALCSPIIRFSSRSTSMLILVAMVGAVVIPARREARNREPDADALAVNQNYL